jgi:hypothetical protein
MSLTVQPLTRTVHLNRRSSGYTQKRPSSLRYPLMSLAVLVAISIVIGIVSAFTCSGTVTIGVKLRVTLDQIANDTFRPDAQSLLWVPEGASFIHSHVCVGSDLSHSQLVRVYSRPWETALSDWTISNLTLPQRCEYSRSSAGVG